MTEQERAERGWPSFERVERMKQVSPGVWVPWDIAEPDRVEGEHDGRNIGEQGE